MIPSALVIVSMLLTGIKSPGNCSGFPCCAKPVNNPEYDPKGKAYGYENGQSCIVPDAAKIIDKVLPEPRPKPLPAIEVPRAEPVAEVLPVEPTPPVEPVAEAPPVEPTEEPNNLIVPPVSPIVENIRDTVSTVVPVQLPKPVATPAIVIPQTFPELPEPVENSAPLKSTCEAASLVLLDDLNQCFAPLVNQVYDRTDDADKISVQAVDCICATSHWRVGSNEIEVYLKSTCGSLGNLTKSQAQEVNNGCSIFPYNYIAVIKAIGSKAQLSSGDLYLPLSEFSGSTALKPSPLFFGMVWLFLNF